MRAGECAVLMLLRKTQIGASSHVSRQPDAPVNLSPEHDLRCWQRQGERLHAIQRVTSPRAERAVADGGEE